MHAAQQRTALYQRIEARVSAQLLQRALMAWTQQAWDAATRETQPTDNVLGLLAKSWIIWQAYSSSKIVVRADVVKHYESNAYATGKVGIIGSPDCSVHHLAHAPLYIFQLLKESS